MSLRFRLSALSVGTLLVLLVAGGAFQYFALGRYLRSDEANVLRQRVTSAIGSNLQLLRAANRCQAPGPVVVDNRVSQPTAQCIVDALSGPSLTVALIDADRQVTASAPAGARPPDLSPPEYQAASQGRPRSYYLIGSGSDQTLVVLHPLGSRNGRSLGVIQVSESAQPLQQTQGRLLFLLAIATGALMLGAVVITPILVGRALRPLQRVTQASSDLAAGDFGKRVEEPPTQDEVGRLARAFNAMAAAVQSAFAVRTASEAGMRHFVGDASHELRTPLTTVQGQLDVLQRGAADDPTLRQESLQSMQREVRRMSVLVEDLLTLTRIETPSEQESARVPVDIDRLIAETVDEQSVRAPGQAVEVETLAPGRAVVMGDPEQLRRVIVNVANNALAHAPGGAHRWRTAVDGSEVVVSLSDQGPGLPVADLPRVFDRFYRGVSGPSAGTPRANGSGLGLAIVKSIVEAHGGSVEASNGEVGATLTVRLPLAAPPAAPTSGGAPQA